MACNGNCSACSGCARELVLTQKEMDFLSLLGQIPFVEDVEEALKELEKEQGIKEA